MNVDLMNPFVDAALSVLEAEVGPPIERGPLTLQRSTFAGQDITAVVAVTGQLQGLVLFGFAKSTALALVSAIIGQEFQAFDDLAESGVAELGNVITGRAAMSLADNGYQAKIAPPLLLSGKGARISTLDITRLVVPIETRCGRVELQLALREKH
ncbi:MAG: chemotaxis protein CheX [Chloroflexota bacterium]